MNIQTENSKTFVVNLLYEKTCGIQPEGWQFCDRDKSFPSGMVKMMAMGNSIEQINSFVDKFVKIGYSVDVERFLVNK